MLKAVAILASIIAATPSWAQEVRVICGGTEHIYGPGGQVLDSPELRAMNERAERRMAQRAMGPVRFRSANNCPVQTSCWQTPRSWWNEVPHQAPTSWWSDPAHQNPPKSVYSDCWASSGNASPIAVLFEIRHKYSVPLGQ
jgi:hypothetical protein